MKIREIVAGLCLLLALGCATTDTGPQTWTIQPGQMAQRLHRNGWFIPASDGLWTFWAAGDTMHPDWDAPPPFLMDGVHLLVRGPYCALVTLDAEGVVSLAPESYKATVQLPDGVWRLERYLLDDDPEIPGAK